MVPEKRILINSTSVFLDCRGWGKAGDFVNKYPDDWKSIPQDELTVRMAEVPKDKRLVLICNTGGRSYEAQIILDRMGFHSTYNLQGGVAAIKKWGLDLLAQNSQKHRSGQRSRRHGRLITHQKRGTSKWI